MPQPKETLEDMRNTVIDIYQSGNGYSTISKALCYQRTTVRATHGENLEQQRAFPGSGQPSKITPAMYRQLKRKIGSLGEFQGESLSPVTHRVILTQNLVKRISYHDGGSQWCRAALLLWGLDDLL